MQCKIDYLFVSAQQLSIVTAGNRCDKNQLRFN